jgi:hypothetical protein
MSALVDRHARLWEEEGWGDDGKCTFLELEEPARWDGILGDLLPQLVVILSQVSLFSEREREREYASHDTSTQRAVVSVV